MSRFSNILKKVLLLLILVMLFLPMAQNKINIFEIEPLKGDVQIPAEMEIEKNTWFNSFYQSNQEEYLNAVFGLRNFCVRLNNQLVYSLFNKVKANGVVIGKENYLFEKKYLLAYNGFDFIGSDSIVKTVTKIKFISDTLKKLNKELVIILASGKASYFPEYIPNGYLPASSQTNYKYYSKELKKTQLNVIDFNKWVMDNKYKSRYPLYAKHGIHWSTYMSEFASDSIIRYIEKTRNIDMPDYLISNIHFETPKNLDYDIADGMNILQTLKGFDVAYADLKTGDTTGKTKPSVLMVSDSYYWEMYNNGIANSFGDNHFWYYNKQVYPQSFKDATVTADLKIDAEIKNHDIIIIMATEANLNYLGWGAIENMYNYLKFGTKLPESINIKIEKIINYIKANKKWLKETKQRAIDKKISTDSALVLEALWQIQIKK